jgi:hypothetical protein
MMSDVARYYQDLLADRVWCAEGLSWTVVQQLTMDEVCRRLAARHIDFAEVLDGRPEGFDPLLVASLAQVGSSVMLFQQYGFEGSRPEVLRRLSDGTRVHNVGWTINGNGTISYAVDGKILTRIGNNDPERRSGEDPSALDEYTADLYAAQQIWNSEQWSTSPKVREAAAMATIEHGTGVRLATEWLDNLHGEPWQTVMLGHDPSDPRPPS